jgi:hypothetical protein
MESELVEKEEIIVSNSELLNEIKKLRSIIENLEHKVDNTNGVIINHIKFINSVFDTIKKPLYFIMNKINALLLEK